MFSHFIKRFERSMLGLSNAPHRGGLVLANGFFFMQVHKDYSGDYKRDCLEFEKKHDLDNFVGFMTAVDVSKVLAVVKVKRVEAYVTAGITNPAIAGDEPPPLEPGTINIALIIKEGLTVGALANAIMTATEAKTYTLLTLGYKATGTTSDGIGVFALPGDIEWAGTATEVGISIGRAVREALKESIKKWQSSSNRL
ncbi:adenosylcobinamide amidohydrolase [Pyrococcus abyssi]|uniref:Adenosylcobinamide amidohydrolase n=1 Tax=Pyrococcus abyssi (strain GE5 / Orsay) TaxID=272844 RepID=Q9V001_PYRAB|nr:adenosylcobinamide amidohydrolase [Pyrococcus abyssi]CAB49905.1 Hypothetical protein PAB1708 [Pyrococcus abyssi GE5]CCE70403.1 TPA: adenosylcobinamide amidohydrolase [Pyrococcus abyssi GE5]